MTLAICSLSYSADTSLATQPSNIPLSWWKAIQNIKESNKVIRPEKKTFPENSWKIGISELNSHVGKRRATSSPVHFNSIRHVSSCQKTVVTMYWKEPPPQTTAVTWLKLLPFLKKGTSQQAEESLLTVHPWITRKVLDVLLKVQAAKESALPGMM